MRILWALALAIALSIIVPAMAEEGATPAPEQGQRTALVTGGATVTMVEPSRSAAEWAAKRPQWEQLRPKSSE